MGVDFGFDNSSSCLMASEMLEGQSSWSSDGNDALFGVLSGGRMGLVFGIFAEVIPILVSNGGQGR